MIWFLAYKGVLDQGRLQELDLHFQMIKEKKSCKIRLQRSDLCYLLFRSQYQVNSNQLDINKKKIITLNDG